MPYPGVYQVGPLYGKETIIKIDIAESDS
jgi:hypothetical protein